MCLGSIKVLQFQIKYRLPVLYLVTFLGKLQSMDRIYKQAIMTRLVLTENSGVPTKAS